jgi:hypothetical protein
MSKSKPSKNSTKRNVVLPEGPKLFALIVFTVVGIIAYITFINYLQSGSLSRSSEASEKLCPISGSHSNGCFIINRCNRDGFGTGESSCYRYINYSCQNGKYAGKNQYLNPLSKCWSEEQALSRISELCGCGGELENKIISCNQTLEYNGNQGITTVQMDLGKGTGMVGLTFNAYENPDKFRVIYNGVDKISTGFRGRQKFNGIDYAKLLDEHYAPKDNLPIIIEPGTGYKEFHKDSSDKDAVLEVEAPLENTMWKVSLTCTED